MLFFLEWVFDTWQREYHDAETDPVHMDALAPSRVLRGGGWSDRAWYSRVSYRYWLSATRKDYVRGFRFVLSN